MSETPLPSHDAEWLRVDEVAMRLRISESLARRLIRENTIPSRRFGRLIRVPADALVSAAVGR